WDNEPYEEYARGQVELTNNIFLEATVADMCFVQETKQGDQRPGDGKALMSLWRCHHNHRDGSGTALSIFLPLALEDRKLNLAELVSRDPDKPDLIRPVLGSSLATQGAGTEDPSLPVYVGALPPEGVPHWDWDKTWRARVAKAAKGAPTPPK